MNKNSLVSKDVPEWNPSKCAEVKRFKSYKEFSEYVDKLKPLPDPAHFFTWNEVTVLNY